jgi:hypothetical protein
VSRAAAMDRELGDDVGLTPPGRVLEHRDQPEFPRPETAIYAGEEAQLLLTLGRDTEVSRDLAERLVGDPTFRQLVRLVGSDWAVPDFILPAALSGRQTWKSPTGFRSHR